MEGAKFIIGLHPDHAALERQPGVEIVERFDGGVPAALLRVREDRTVHAERWFGGVSHVYDTEEEARRVWQLFVG